MEQIITIKKEPTILFIFYNRLLTISDSCLNLIRGEKLLPVCLRFFTFCFFFYHLTLLSLINFLQWTQTFSFWWQVISLEFWSDAYCCWLRLCRIIRFLRKKINITLWSSIGSFANGLWGNVAFGELDLEFELLIQLLLWPSCFSS